MSKLKKLQFHFVTVAFFNVFLELIQQISDFFVIFWYNVIN